MVIISLTRTRFDDAIPNFYMWPRKFRAFTARGVFALLCRARPHIGGRRRADNIRNRVVLVARFESGQQVSKKGFRTLSGILRVWIGSPRAFADTAINVIGD